MNCDTIRDRLTAWVLNDLDPGRAEAVARHVESCPACRAEADSLRAAADSLRDALAARAEPAARLPDKARRSIRRVYDARRRAAGRERSVRLRILVHVAMAAGLMFILSGLLLPNLGDVREKARRVNDLANLNGLYKSAVTWGLDPADSFRPPVPPSLDDVVKAGNLPEEMTLNVSTRKPVEYYPEAAGKGGDMPLLVSPGHGGRNVVRVAGQGLWVEDGTAEARELDDQLAKLKREQAGSKDGGLELARAEALPREGSVDSKQRHGWTGRSAQKSVTIRGAFHYNEPVPAAQPASGNGTAGPLAEGHVKKSALRESEALAGELGTMVSAARKQRLDRVRDFQRNWAVSGERRQVQASELVPPPDLAVSGPKMLIDEDSGAVQTPPPGQEYRRQDKSYAAASVARLRVEPPASSESDLKIRSSGRVTSDSAPGASMPKPPSKPDTEPAPPAAPAAAGPQPRASGVHPFVAASDSPCSTFSIDVDTASYTHARQYLLGGKLPPPESVRTEEFVNYFDYAYPPPARGPFAVHTECGPTPFGRGLALLKIGVKARRLGREEQRPLRLTLLIDTSGSMATPERMGLVKEALGLMLERLDPADRVALVQFDTQARLVLESTPASEPARIRAALDGLQPSGSTSLETGMRAAYEVAARAFDGSAFNRVLLLTDGMANLGATDAEAILAAVASYRKQGITLSVFGVGFGSYNDALLETLAGQGDGQYAFLDSRAEAERVLADELAASAAVIARDVKIQVEFDPARVRRYRQIGYENRALTREQFRDDTVDAGEIGSGQSVTALYELELQGAPDAPLGVVRVRSRNALTGRIEELEQPVSGPAPRARFEAMDARFRLAAAAAEFAELLRGSPHAAGSRFEDVARALYPVAAELSLDARIAELLRLTQTGLIPVFRDAVPPTERTSP